LKQKVELMSSSHLEESSALTIRLEQLELDLNKQSHQRQELSKYIEAKEEDLENITVENGNLKQQNELMCASNIEESLALTKELKQLQLELNEQSQQRQKLANDYEEKGKELDEIKIDNESLKQNIELMGISNLEGSLASTEKLEKLQLEFDEQSHQRQELSKDLEEKGKELEQIMIDYESLKQQNELMSSSHLEESLASTEIIERLQQELNHQSHQRQELSDDFQAKEEDLEKMTVENGSLKEQNELMCASNLDKSRELTEKMEQLQLELTAQSHQRQELFNKYESSRLFVMDLKDEIVTLKNSLVDKNIENIEEWNLSAGANLEQMKSDLSLLKNKNEEKEMSPSESGIFSRILCVKPKAKIPS